VGSANGSGADGSTETVSDAFFSIGRVVGEFNANPTPTGASVGNVPVSGTFNINFALTN
jgi:hypothetical protein